jgi:hypothetical protein
MMLERVVRSKVHRFRANRMIVCSIEVIVLVP